MSGGDDDRYLWDRSGPPDPDVARLEKALGEWRPASPPPPLAQPAAADDAAAAARVPLRHLSRLTFRFAVAATVLLALLVGVAWLAVRRDGGDGAGPAATWGVAAVEGAPTLGASPLVGAVRAAPGQAVVTDARSRARIEIAALGHVEVAPNSRVRLLSTGERVHRIALDEGRVSALTWAPPRRFFVETPVAVAADLGCSFTLDVEPGGASLLRVDSGYVAFERGGIESIVPAGAECRARPGVGPGTPVLLDAPAPLKDALARFDFEGAREADLDAALASARPEDALSVWHLFPRAPAAARARLYDRLAALAPPPGDVSRDAVLALDRATLERWRDALRP